MDGKVPIEIGAHVSYNGSIYRISLISVIGIELTTGNNRRLPLNKLKPASAVVPDSREINAIPPGDWRTAEKRYAVIAPLLGRKITKRTDVEQRAREAGINTSTVYRWIKRYKQLGLPALVPRRRGWTLGKHRRGGVLHEIISSIVREYVGSPANNIVQEVTRVCNDRGIKPPSAGTVRLRIKRDIETRGAAHADV